MRKHGNAKVSHVLGLFPEHLANRLIMLEILVLALFLGLVSSTQSRLNIYGSLVIFLLRSVTFPTEISGFSSVVDITLGCHSQLWLLQAAILDDTILILVDTVFTSAAPHAISVTCRSLGENFHWRWFLRVLVSGQLVGRFSQSSSRKFIQGTLQFNICRCFKVLIVKFESD